MKTIHCAYALWREKFAQRSISIYRINELKLGSKGREWSNSVRNISFRCLFSPMVMFSFLSAQRALKNFSTKGDPSVSSSPGWGPQAQKSSFQGFSDLFIYFVQCQILDDLDL